MTGRVLVAGGGGFLGRHIVAAFLARGRPVTVIDVAGPPKTLDRQVDWITASITDAGLLGSAAIRCEAVVFLASSSLPAASQADLAIEVESHVLPAVRAAELCARVGVKRFVFASSGGTVYGTAPPHGQALREDMPTRPLSGYGASKLGIEHYLRLIGARTGMAAVALRVANPYGEGQRAVRGQGFIAAAFEAGLSGAPLTIWGDGSVARDFLYVGDVADAFARAASHDDLPPVMNIGSGTATALSTIVAEISKTLGEAINVRYTADRPIDVPTNALDIGLAQRTLGWTPKTSRADGLARTAAWWRAPPV